MKKYDSIAVLIPAFNEETTIQQVVLDFKKNLPEAQIYVYDNKSTDKTRELATKAGAVVKNEMFRGKGNVVRRMFADIEAEVYILVDGDDTYDASKSREMIDLLYSSDLDMVVGARLSNDKNAFPVGHRFGNSILNKFVHFLFGRQFDDMLSGFRAFSRRFVKTFPALSKGFEIETELTVHSLEMRLPVAEIRVAYKERPKGSDSKLNTFRDGFRIVFTILSLLRINRPMRFFGIVSVILFILSLIIFYPILTTYIETGLVPRLPTAILSAFMMLGSAMSLSAGVVLHSVTRNHLEIKRLQYLNYVLPRIRKNNIAMVNEDS